MALRNPVAGPEDGPQSPFPIKVSGRIIKGFGRGSKELGIPTANIPIEGLDVGGHTDVESGVYYGWAGLSLATSTSDSRKASYPPGYKDDSGDVTSNAQEDTRSYPVRAATAAEDTQIPIYPMVMSIGWNPYYKNKARTVEVHIIHKFEEDFYNALMNITILGFIRQEKDYDGLDALIKDINIDINVAKSSLKRKPYADLASDSFLRTFSWAIDS